jgi:hypothetical protein
MFSAFVGQNDDGFLYGYDLWHSVGVLVELGRCYC